VGLLIFLGLALWTFARRGTSILACLALLPLLHLVPVTRWWSPHYLYVPLAFASLAVLELLREQVKTLAVVAAGALLFCAPKSWLGSARYRDDESLFTPELTAHPEFREAQFYVAELERQRGHFELARAGYVRALEPRPGVLAYVDQKAAFGNLATVELELGRPEVARRLFQRAKQLATRDEERRQLNYNEALAAFRTGAFVETARLLEDEVERPDALAWAIRLRRDALARSPSR
jgi:tetratricopeptide (TPR) repeat protein